MKTFMHFMGAILCSLLFTSAASAYGTSFGSSMGGGHSVDIGIGLTSASQDDLNSHIDAVNAANATSINHLGSAYEFVLGYEYRFAGTMYALHFRPSYFTQSTSSNGYKYSLTGYTFYPMFRIYPLENGFIHFFMQIGAGYGQLNGKISQPGGEVTFHGSSFGAIGGLGAQFCFTAENCVAVEGDLRYNSIDRNLVESSSGVISQMSQYNQNELEYGGKDVGTTLSGIQGIVSYVLKF